MQTITVKIKKPLGWNTVNIRNSDLILKNCVLSCNGLYTDDYAHDAKVNCERDLTSEECIKKIRDSTLTPKLYWDSEKKHFLFFYGNWLSYSAKPNNLKVVEQEVKDNFIIPEEVNDLREVMQEKEKVYFKQQGFKNIQPETVSVKNRKKYYALDVGTSGKFLIDKGTLSVYSIKAYGQKGYLQGTVKDVTERVQQDINILKKVMSEGLKAYSLYY